MAGPTGPRLPNAQLDLGALHRAQPIRPAHCLADTTHVHPAPRASVSTDKRAPGARRPKRVLERVLEGAGGARCGREEERRVEIEEEAAGAEDAGDLGE